MKIGVRIGRESNGHELIEPGRDRVRHGSFAVGDEANAKASRQRGFALNGLPAHSKTVPPSESSAARASYRPPRIFTASSPPMGSSVRIASNSITAVATGIPRGFLRVAHRGNWPSRADPAGGRRKLPPTPANPRNDQGRKDPALAGNPRLSPLSPEAPRPACHAGGRGFESRRSRSPATASGCFS